ncbi:MAG: PBP1A family penicillin-binding protein [Lachnospiraceae bacterium]|nr:PBP1A family penicillin-binding protein [Lachnospiraceae bacterium]
MSEVKQNKNQKKSQKKKKHKKKYRLYWFFIRLQILFLILVAAGLGWYYFGGYAQKVSALQQEAKKLVRESNEDTFRSVQTSLVYDANGTLVSTLKGEKDVYYLDFEDIPPYAAAAMVSIEDKKFYSHNGIDIKAIMRAAKAMIQNGKVTQGGSTITQQLSRNIFLNHDVKWERKIEEMFIAVELEKVYSKNKIMEFYLNNVYFGNGYYGIQAASKGYFNTEVKNLDLSQIAFLCAIPNNPSLYDPLVRIENTLKRRNRILNQMEEDGKISQETCNQAKAEKIVLNPSQKTKNDYVETYTYNCAIRALMAEEGFTFRQEFDSEEQRSAYEEEYDLLYSECQKNLYSKGYRIYTSIDLNMQQMLQDTVDQGLAEFTEQTEDGIFTLQGSAVCIDNHTGYVKAIVGGRNQNLSGYTLNRAYQSYRQPGSSIKPLIVYAPVLERNYTPDSVVADVKTEDGPSNSGGSYEGNISLRYAVSKSKNTVAWNLLEELTPQVGLSYLKAMNFAKLDVRDERPTSALGGFTNGVSAVEMASAYAALEHDGKFREPTVIVKITDAQDNVIVETNQEEKEVYKVNASRMTTDMLVSVMKEGTGRGLALSNMPCAGKTGTTNDNKDGWFVGYTGYYTTSVWVGYDMPRELPGLSGASYPGSIWKNFMELLHQNLEPVEFLPYIDEKKLPLDDNEYQQGQEISPEEGAPQGELPQYAE